MEEEWQTEHFNNRRIAHGRKGKSAGKGGAFDPRRAYGVYQLQCPALAKIPEVKSNGQNKRAVGTLEIHGPVDGRADALMCTLDMPEVLSGVGLLAGSRKVLNSVIRELEQPDPAEDEDGDEDEDRESGLDDNAVPHDKSSDEAEEAKSSIELADERERQRYAAFEKNSFRSPKFWMRWRALVSGGSLEQSAADGPDAKHIVRTVEVNGGYLVFSGNDCASFNGTMSCDVFDWKNVKLSGSKVVSKARECHLGWNDVVAG